ncbi:MAG: 3-isopropylmalate dehydratase small subunit [Myxococcales bacterium]|jgi:3-isopropylmalate/(R)-2-methylmalate dehydratase small subunit
MNAFTTLTSTVLPMPTDDIDTDQIIPARFLKVTDKVGLGKLLFADWRTGADGQPKPDFPLHLPEARGARVLIAGRNFGCGSSREHAPWALYDFGFRAIVALSFADIFQENAIKNGLLPVAVDAATHKRLLAAREGSTAITVTIDLPSQTLALPDGTKASFPIDGFSKRCLLNGVDELGYILSFTPAIESYEAKHA